MGLKHSLAALEAASGGEIPYKESLMNMGHSALCGALLMLITVWATYQTLAIDMEDEDEPEIDSPSELILNSSNILFICFGMTCVMALVNNNLARAFTIGSTIALIRLKIRLNSKTINIGLFYGALVGMACGVDQSKLGYVAVLAYGVFQLVIVGMAKVADQAKRALIRRRKNLKVLRDPLPQTPLAAQAPVNPSQDLHQ